MSQEEHPVEVPDLENGLSIKKWILEEAVSGWKSEMLALGNGTVGVDQLL